MRLPKEIIINNKTLEQILIDHKHWLNQDCIGWENMRANLYQADLSEANLNEANLNKADLCEVNLKHADLSGADLCDADLSRANLDCAYLQGAYLQGANLSRANLHHADLYHTDLWYANLYNANLYNANLACADLQGADLYYAGLACADLQGADLSHANLHNANLHNAGGKLIEYRKGKILTEDIIGYKKCKNDVIVTLKIPRGAIIFSINGYKCRTNKAKVISIDGTNRAYSKYTNMSYYVGDEFNIYNFNCEYNVECAEGIHFFISKEEAEQYEL